MNPPHAILSLIRSHLEGLEETGVSRLRLDGPFKKTASPASPERPNPRQVVQSTPVVPKEPEPDLLPKTEVPPVVPADAPSALTVRILTRMEACGDTVPTEESRVVLVIESHELEEENGRLLSEMLKAIGYEAATEDVPFREGDVLAGRGKRVLAMGNPALRAVSTSGMNLGIVRGMWQQSPHGKLLSTYAPSYLKENPPGKKAAWGDLQILLKDLRLEVPAWTRRKLKRS